MPFMHSFGLFRVYFDINWICVFTHINQPLPADASPTALSPGYVNDSDPKEDPEEDPKEDPEKDPVDYLADRGDDDDEEEEEESFQDDDDHEEEEAFEEDKDEEDEHLAPADSAAATPPPRSPRTNVLFSQTRLRKARKSVRLSPLPQIPSPPLPLPSPPTHTSPTYADAPLGYKVAVILSRATSPPPIPSPPCYYHLLITGVIFPRRICHFERGYVLLLLFPVSELLGDAHELHMRDEDAQDDRALIRAQISLLTRESDMVTSAFGRIHALESRDQARPDDLEDTSNSSDALAEHEANKNSRNGDDCQDSRSGGRRHMTTTHECTYSDILKCHPLISRLATCTLLGSALTWWNSHVKIVGHDAAYVITWKTLRKMMTDKYCPRSELKKLEIEIWNLKVKEESNKVEKYVSGLPNMIQGSLMASKPKIMQDAIEFATELMDQKIHTFADPRAYTAGPGEKKEYGGSLPLCPKCNYHHNGQCAPSCNNCKKVGHLARDCRGNGKATAKAYAVGNARKNLNSNVVTGTFLLNNHYASILFDTGADRSFIFTAFCSLIDIFPATLDHYYDVELVDEKIIEVNTIIRGCTLNFLNHPFNIDLMPVKLGSFDLIIGMEWLVKYHAVIVCDEKIVRIPFRNEILIVCGDRSNNGHESRLNIISCKGYDVFLAHVTTKKAEDKSKEK
ncbi:putative reverse transcriptase domain-containing protein [Tanacetum coccineum]